MNSMLCMIVAGVCAVTPPSNGSITGIATVQDGDTIYVGGQAIRLFGVDAEEIAEPHGVRAKLALRNILRDAGPVRCTPVGSHSYSRTVARCFAGASNVEINESIIASGWALDCKRYSGGMYARAEAPGARAKLLQKPYCK